MGPFLEGFVGELIKISQPSPIDPYAAPAPTATAGGVVRPASTATGNERAPAPAQTNFKPGTLLRAIPTQRMESPAGNRQAPWRPSPGYRPNPASDPKPAPAAPARTGRGATKPSNATPAWETAQQKETREQSEGAYNKRLAGGAGGSSIKPKAPGGYHLKPGQAPTPARPTPSPTPTGPSPATQRMLRESRRRPGEV